MTEYFKCDCCGKKTIEEKTDYEECRYCGWIDDPWALDDIYEPSCGANNHSLFEARELVKSGNNAVDNKGLPYYVEKQ